MSLLKDYICPNCGESLSVEYRRPRSLAHWAYRGHCATCGWEDILQQIWCDSCDGLSFGALIDEELKCVRCGSVVQVVVV